MIHPGLNIVLDAQWGSTGKGKLCGFLGKFKPDLCCSSFGPNAGHTYIGDDGRAIVLKFLPGSCIKNRTTALIMPDSAIVVEDLLKEVELLGVTCFVHPRAAVVTPDDKNSAEITGKHLAGTMKGTGHAMARKMLRIKGTALAKDVLPGFMVRDTCQMVRDCVRKGGKVMFEMSQGFDLSLNHGCDYPYLTSRDITVGACINSAGVSHREVSQVIGSMRTFPIRVGNIEGGYSGPCHRDQCELTWDEVTQLMGSKVPISETTTVTKRVRRVFTFSMEQMIHFVQVNRPDWLFLNFIQYLDAKMAGARYATDLTPAASTFIENLELETGVRVKLVGTGPNDADLVEL